MHGFLFFLHTVLCPQRVCKADSEEKVIKNSDVVGGDRWGRGPPISKAPLIKMLLPT